jgi:hypothetical protein
MWSTSGVMTWQGDKHPRRFGWLCRPSLCLVWGGRWRWWVAGVGPGCIHVQSDTCSTLRSGVVRNDQLDVPFGQAFTIDTPLSVGDLAAERRAWGIVVLAAFVGPSPGQGLNDYLNTQVFADTALDTASPTRQRSPASTHSSSGS